MKSRHFNRAFTKALLFLPLFLLTLFYSENLNGQREDRRGIETYTDAEILQLAEYITEWLTADLIYEHIEDFYASPDSTFEAGNGGVHNTRNFLGWHRNQVRALEGFLETKGTAAQEFIPLPKWEPTDQSGNINPIPVYFNGKVPNGGDYEDYIFRNKDEFGNTDPDLMTTIDSILMQNGFDFSMSYLDSISPNVPYVFAGFGQNGAGAYDMNDYCSYPDVGDFSDWFEVHYHAYGHFQVGGVMISPASPASLIFWLYHAQIDELWFIWDEDVCTNYTFTNPTASDLLTFLGNPSNPDTIYIRGELVIEDGDSIRLNGKTLHFQDSEYNKIKSGIRIKPGGILELRSSTLTGFDIFGNGGGNFAGDDFNNDGIPDEGGMAAAAKGVVYNSPWDGIILEQGLNAEGKPALLDIRDFDGGIPNIIEHARIGIYVENGFGRVQALRTEFIDNRKAVVFGEEQSLHQMNNSEFEICRFVQSDYLRDAVWKSDKIGQDGFRYYKFNFVDSDKAENFVEIYNIENVETNALFSNCTFELDESFADTLTGSSSNTITGIYAQSSDFIIAGGTFSNLAEGVYYDGEGSNENISFSGNPSFSNVLTAITLEDVNNISLVGLNINVPGENNLTNDPNVFPIGIKILGNIQNSLNISGCDFQTEPTFNGQLVLNRGIDIQTDNGVISISNCEFSNLVEGLNASSNTIASSELNILGGTIFSDNLKGAILNDISLADLSGVEFIVPANDADLTGVGLTPIGLQLNGSATFCQFLGVDFSTANTSSDTLMLNRGIELNNATLDGIGDFVGLVEGIYATGNAGGISIGNGAEFDDNLRGIVLENVNTSNVTFANFNIPRNNQQFTNPNTPPIGIQVIGPASNNPHNFSNNEFVTNTNSSGLLVGNQGIYSQDGNFSSNNDMFLNLVEGIFATGDAQGNPSPNCNVNQGTFTNNVIGIHLNDVQISNIIDSDFNIPGSDINLTNTGEKPIGIQVQGIANTPHLINICDFTTDSTFVDPLVGNRGIYGKTGNFTCSGSNFSNLVEGIYAMGDGTPTSLAAITVNSNSDFTNNVKGIVLDNINTSTIENSFFNIPGSDEDFLDNGDTPIGIHVLGIAGAPHLIDGNNFTTDPSFMGTLKVNQGIFGEVANFTCEDSDFSNLIEGINALGDGTVGSLSSITVSNSSNFTNNLTGIILENINTSTVEGSDFNIPVDDSGFKDEDERPIGISIIGIADAPHLIQTSNFTSIAPFVGNLDKNRGIQSLNANFTSDDNNFSNLVDGIYAEGDIQNEPLSSISVTNTSSFINNIRGVVLDNVNTSTIENSSFDVPGSDEALTSTGEMPVGLQINGIADNPHLIQLSTFRTDPTFSGTIQENRGIYGNIANFTSTDNDFIGLVDGIYAQGDIANAPDASITVNNQCLFDGNLRGLVLDHVNTSVISDSDFFVPGESPFSQIDELPIGLTITGVTTTPHAISTTNFETSATATFPINDNRGVDSRTANTVFTGCSFSNLAEGIRVEDIELPNSGAEIKVLSNSVFEDNFVGVFLNNAEKSTIEQTSFNIPPFNSITNNISTPAVGILIEGTAILPQVVDDCEFQTTPASVGQLAANRGIHCYLGNLNLRSSNFENLVEGVYAVGDQMAAPDAVVTISGTTADSSRFTNNIYGVVFQNVNLSSIDTTNFTVPAQNPIGVGKPVGIHLVGPSAYVVRDNFIESSGSNPDNIGILTEFSCFGNITWLAENDIKNIKYGIRAEEFNARVQISCNNFLQVDGNFSIALESGILPEQGDCEVIPSGNTWDNSLCTNIQSQIYINPNSAYGFTYNSHSDRLPAPSCSSIEANIINCFVEEQNAPCDSLDTSFNESNDPNRINRILALNARIKQIADTEVKESIKKIQELEIMQGTRFELRENGVTSALAYLESLLNQEIDIYKGDLAALAFQTNDMTGGTSYLNQMDNEDPNKFYLALIRELKGEGKELVDLTTTELTQLIQSIEGQFPSIPRECTTTILTDHEFNGLSANENSIFAQKQEYKLARVNKETLSSKISIYPNPTRSFFTLEIEDLMQQDGLLSVFNASGQLVEKGMITSAKQEWSTNNLPSGVYTVIVTIDQAIFKEKLVVIR